MTAADYFGSLLEHDPKKREPVFGQDHALTYVIPGRDKIANPESSG
jgi:hypothetical protein